MRLSSIVPVALMVVAMLAAALIFKLPAGVFLLIGAAGMLLEKPMQRLSEKLAAIAGRLEAEIEQEKLQCR